MSDFTKEELKIIYLNLCVNDKTKIVLNKLEQLIINYDDKNKMGWENLCHKCGEFHD